MRDIDGSVNFILENTVLKVTLQITSSHTSKHLAMELLARYLSKWLSMRCSFAMVLLIQCLRGG